MKTPTPAITLLIPLKSVVIASMAPPVPRYPLGLSNIILFNSLKLVIVESINLNIFVNIADTLSICVNNANANKPNNPALST